mgnify:CR=1 FL=1
MLLHLLNKFMIFGFPEVSGCKFKTIYLAVLENIFKICHMNKKEMPKRKWLDRDHSSKFGKVPSKAHTQRVRLNLGNGFKGEVENVYC